MARFAELGRDSADIENGDARSRPVATKPSPETGSLARGAPSADPAVDDDFRLVRAGAVLLPDHLAGSGVFGPKPPEVFRKEEGSRG